MLTQEHTEFMVRKERRMKVSRAALAPGDALAGCSLLHTAKQAALSKLLKRIWVALFLNFRKQKCFAVVM